MSVPLQRCLSSAGRWPHVPLAGWWPFDYRHVDREHKLGNVALPFLDHDLVQSYLPQLSHESGGQSAFDEARAAAEARNGPTVSKRVSREALAGTEERNN